MIFFLHGFGGSIDDVEPLKRYTSGQVFPLVIPGHAGGPRLAELGIQSMDDLLKYLAGQIKEMSRGRKFYLAGYSMGGRLAILLGDYLDRKPDGLILLSTGLGIINRSERTGRRLQDKNWAETLRSDKSVFWQRWYDQPLFYTLKKQVDFDSLLEKKLRCDPEELGSVLSIAGAAEHDYLEKNLLQYKSVLYVVGSRDKKYVRLAQKIADFENLAVAFVPEASHSILIEAPEICGQIINSWFDWNMREVGSGVS